MNVENLFGHNEVDILDHNVFMTESSYARRFARDMLYDIIQGRLNIPNVDFLYRVSLMPDDMVYFTEFKLPREHDDLTANIPRWDLPEVVAQKLCVLEMCDVGHVVDGVGMRVNKTTFYIDGEQDDNSKPN